MTGFYQLFRYANTLDVILLVMGIICSALVGLVSPINILIMRTVLNKFISAQIAADIYDGVILFTILGACGIVLAFLESMCMNIFAKRQASKMRLLYFKSVMRQDVAWFENESTGALMSKFTANIDTIESVIGMKLAMFVQYIAGFVGGLIIAFFIDWKLSLVASTMLPLIGFVMVLSAVVIKYFAKKEFDAYTRAGSVCTEVLTNIRTVVSFGGERKELKRYTNELGSAERCGVIQSTVTTGVLGTNYFIFYSVAALVLWYGTELLLENEFDPGAVITVFVNILVSGIFLGYALPFIPYFISARTAGIEINNLIEQVPKIDKDAEGVTLPNPQCNISFNNIGFCYPTRPEMKQI